MIRSILLVLVLVLAFGVFTYAMANEEAGDEISMQKWDNGTEVAAVIWKGARDGPTFTNTGIAITNYAEAASEAALTSTSLDEFDLVALAVKRLERSVVFAADQFNRAYVDASNSTSKERGLEKIG